MADVRSTRRTRRYGRIFRHNWRRAVCPSQEESRYEHTQII